MKKLLLASAVAALSITAAQAAPQVYGKAFLTLDVAEGDVDATVVTNGRTATGSAEVKARTQLNSNASRIGFKGAEALTANTDLVYQLEYGVDVDSDTDQFYSRDTYLGLANKQYGTLVAGRLTAIDDYINYVDVIPVSNVIAGVNLGTGRVVSNGSVLASIDGERANNAFAYFSPNYNGFTAMAMYALDENNATDSFDGDVYGVGFKYEPTNAPYKLGATYIATSQGGDKDEGVQAIRVSGAYALNPALTLGALYQNTDFDSDDNENAVSVSGKYKVAQTPWTTYAQLDFVDNIGGDKDSEAQRLTIGGEYAFNQNTTGHIYGAYLKAENTNYVDANNYSKVEFDGFGLGAGLEYKF